MELNKRRGERAQNAYFANDHAQPDTSPQNQPQATFEEDEPCDEPPRDSRWALFLDEGDAEPEPDPDEHPDIRTEDSGGRDRGGGKGKSRKWQNHRHAKDGLDAGVFGGPPDGQFSADGKRKGDFRESFEMKRSRFSGGGGASQQHLQSPRNSEPAYSRNGQFSPKNAQMHPRNERKWNEQPPPSFASQHHPRDLLGGDEPGHPNAARRKDSMPNKQWGLFLDHARMDREEDAGGNLHGKERFDNLSALLQGSVPGGKAENHVGGGYDEDHGGGEQPPVSSKWSLFMD